MGMCNIHWYDILIQSKYVDHFSRPDLTVFSIKDGRKVYDPLFAEFRSIILGLTIACSIGRRVPEGYEKELAKRDLYEYLGYRYFLDVCPNGQHRFSVISESMHRHGSFTLDDFSAEQTAVRILYPFWSRTDGSFEDRFAQSGDSRFFCFFRYTYHKGSDTHGIQRADQEF